MTFIRYSSVRATASAFGVYAGILGMEHGYFEALQGNAAPKSLKIFAVSPSELPFPFGHEPALTVIPNFLITGILAIIAGLAILLWSAAFIQREHGAAVLSLLSVLLSLVGGGFGPIALLITATIGATGIHQPLTWWRAHFSGGPGRVLARLWPWAFAAALLWVPAEFVAGQILHIGNDHRQTLTNVNLLLSYPLLVFFVLSLLTAFAREIRLPADPHRISSTSSVPALPEVSRDLVDRMNRS